MVMAMMMMRNNDNDQDIYNLRSRRLRKMEHVSSLTKAALTARVPFLSQ